MSNKKFTIIFGILLALFVAQHLLIKQPGLFRRDKASSEFHEIQFELLDGSIEPVGYYKDKQPVILFFWTDNCNPCQLALDNLEEQVARLKEKIEVEIITVASGLTAEEAEKVKSLWEIDLKVGLDRDYKIAEKLGISRFPTLIAINKDGEQSGRFDSFDPDAYDDIDYYLGKNGESDVIDTTEVIIQTDDKTDTSKIDTIEQDKSR